MTDPGTLARQYGDDRNLRARQRLWEVSRSDPPLDFHRWSVDLLDVQRSDRVLDAGCGNGHPLALLRERTDQAVGIDLSPGMAAAAGHPRVAVADVQRLPFRDGTFDSAAAFMMLYHVPDPELAAVELRRVVRPGGLAVATTASADNQIELRALVEQVVGGGWTWNRPSSMNFHLENGAAVLGRAFALVDVVRAPERRVHVTDADALADYVRSTGDTFGRTLPPSTTWDDVVEAVRSAVVERGSFVTVARLGAFACR